MTPRPEETQRIERAKNALLKEFGQRPWFRGAGIAPGKEGLQLRLNVDPEAKLAEGEIPERFHGFPLKIVLIAAYRPREKSEGG